MTQKLLCLCAAVALLIAFSTANVASAQEAVAVPEPSAPVAACPCEFGPAVACRVGCYRAAWYAPGCPPVVTYRVGLFGHIRPVVAAPVCYPAPVVCRPAPVVYRPAYVPRLAVGYPCAVPYCAPARVYAPYCW